VAHPQAPALDGLDLSILKQLLLDGRRPFTRIADELGVSHGTIRNRFLRMVELHSLDVACWLDPKKINFHGGAQFKLAVDPRCLKDAAAIIADFPEVVWFTQAMGEFNLMGDAWCVDILHLEEFLDRDLYRLPGINSAEIGIYHQVHKVSTLPPLELLDYPPQSATAGSRSQFAGPYPLEGGRQPVPAAPGSPTRNLPDSLTLDELDIEILKHLSVDGRKPFTEIGEALGISHATVRNRYNRLIEINALRLICWLDPQKVGFKVAAHIDLSVRLPHLAAAIDEIVRMPEVVWLGQVLGEFNLMADVMCLSKEHLDDFVSQRMHNLAGLDKLETTVYSQILKFVTAPNLELLQRILERRGKIGRG